MQIIDFENRNTIYAKEQPEYLPLPAYRRLDGEITCCWKLNWRERIRVLFSGVLWLSVLTFNEPLQPLKLEVDKPEDMRK